MISFDQDCKDCSSIAEYCAMELYGDDSMCDVCSYFMCAECPLDKEYDT